MKNKFQSKSVPRGTRTIWRYLGALFILFTFAIGNVWAADEVVVIGSQSSGNLTIATNTHSVAGISGGTNSGTIIDASDGQSVSGGSKMGGTSEIGSKLVTKSKQHIRFTVVAGETVRFYYYQTGGANKSSTFATSDFSQSDAYYHGATAYNAAAKNTLYFVDFVFADAGTYAISLTTGQSVYMAALKFTAPAAAHTVTYKAGDGSGSDVVDSDAKTVKAFADCSFTAPSGYEFKEWQDGSSNVVAAGATVSADMTLTAIYRLIPTKYTVTYNLNGASGDAPTETSKAEGDAFNLAAAPSWAGHAFDGWLCSADEAVKAAGSSYTMTAANTTFTAQWHEVDCKIYSLTGGIGSAVVQQANATVNDGVSLILSNSDGIIKLSPASGSFNAGDIVTISGTVGNTTKEFGVKISNAADKKANLGTASVAGTTNPMVATATLSAASDYLYICRTGGTTQTILTCEVHRACAEGTAAGLSYAEAEVNKTEGDAAFTNPLTNANSLVLDGYKSSNEEVATVNFSTGEVTIVGAGSATITANSAVQTKAGTLYAVGTASYTLTVAALPKYHVTYDLNDGSGSPSEVDHKAGEKFNLHDGVTGITAPTNKTFVNWKDQDDALFAGGAEYTMPAKNVTLTAQWAGDVYTVKFMDGETVLDTKVVEVGSHPTDIEHPTKPLFVFAAWQLSGSDVNLDEVSGAKDAVVTLTARWTKAYANSVDFVKKITDDGTSGWAAYLEANNYYIASTTGVSFDNTNAFDTGLKMKTTIGNTLSFSAAAGKVIDLTVGNISGMTIAINGGEASAITSGTDATHLGVSHYYAVGDQEVVLTETVAGYNIIRQITIRDPYEVSYDPDGGDPVSAQYGEPSVTLPLPVKGTESFLGWFDGETKVGEAGESYTPTANITLKAHWEAVSTDARLASITFSSDAGTLSPAFDPEVTNYTYTMPYGTAAVPTITGATKANPAAQEPVIDAQAAAWGETAHVHGVAASDDTKDYYVQMLRAPKDGVCLIKGNVGDNTFVIDEEASLLSGTPSKNSVKSESSTYETLTGWKFNSRPAHLGLTLSEGTFQAGDVVEVFVTDVANGGGGTHKMRVFDADEATPAHVLAESTADMVQGVNRLVLPATSTSSLYLHRGAKDADYENWNPYVAYFAVYRAMNPVLTAITIDGRDGEIDALNDKHFSVTIPYESDLAALTVVPTIVWNAAAATNSIVVNSGSAWTLGDNTYVLTDKDGDATTYTITLTRDVLKHTVSFNTHGGSVVASEEVEHNAYLAAAPADPTKEDYIFQYWSLSDGGAEVDVTTVQIDEDKTFHAVWAAETGVIKLLDGEGNVNTTDFITGVTAGTVNFDDEDHNCASFGSTGGDIIGKDGAGKFIVYNSKTTQTKIKFVLYNTNSSPKQITLQKLVEGADDTEDVVIDVPSQERFETPYYTFNNTANRTMYAWTNSTSVKVLQVKVVDDGTPVKQAGEVGYSLNLNLGRVFASANMEVEYDGLAFEASSNYKVLNSTELQTKKNISFTVASPVTLVLESTGAKYQVSTDAAGSGDEYAAGTNEHDLTAGTWHIVPTTTSNMKFTNIAFTAPKCEKPAIVDMSDVDLCENDSYTALTVSASVSDGGTLHYAWFKEAGATDEAVGTDAASFTPDADGEYYVIVTNQKDGFADNTETSNVVTVQHLAGTTITTAPVSVRKNAGEAATLTVVAAGKNLAYEWFTCNADGTGAVAVDPAATEASLDVIVPDGEQYYKVVVTGDCGTVEAIAKVEKWVKLTQQDVTENTVWDWANAGENIKLTSETTPKKNEEYLMANIRVNGVSPTNDATFNSQALLFYGENVRAVDGGRAYASIGHISFTTTVPGVVVVEFSNNKKTSDNQPRRVSINGKQSETSLGTNDVKTFLAVVPEGEVVITGVNEAGTSSDQYIRISKITFTKVDYTRPVTAGRYGTICLPNGGKIYGATLYEVAYYGATSQKIFFDEILSGELVAGTPYIFQPNSGEDLLAVAYTDNTGAYAGAANGLIGFIGASENAETQVPADGTCYILQNNQYRQVLAGADARIKSNRAYIKLTAINPSEPALAPGRRRISMGVQSEQVATGIGDVQGDEVQSSKVLINGQLFILRGEKMYDATGRWLVK